MPKEYVVGLAFNPDESRVLVICKNRPDWQRGRLNGIGGKVEPGETPLEAMEREWKEEVLNEETHHSDEKLTWTLFAILEGIDEIQGLQESFILYYFRTNVGYHYNLISGSKGEYLTVISTDEIPDNVISNMTWTIPMARTRNRNQWPLLIRESLEKDFIFSAKPI